MKSNDVAKTISNNNLKAQQKVAQSRGESEAIRIINEELQRSPQYINYLMMSKWDGKMPLALGSGSLLSITNNTR